MRIEGQTDLLHIDDPGDDPSEFTYRPRQRRFTRPTDSYTAIRHQDATHHHTKENDR